MRTHNIPFRRHIPLFYTANIIWDNYYDNFLWMLSLTTNVGFGIIESFHYQIVFDYAVTTEDLEAVELLLGLDYIDPNRHGAFPLRYAAMSCHSTDILRVLLLNGARRNIQNILELAKLAGRRESVALLQEYTH